MQVAPHIAIMQNTIAYMRAVLMFPPVEEIHNPRFKYYLNVAILCSSTIFLDFGTLLHIIVNCIRKTYVSLGFDLSCVFTVSGAYINNINCLLHIKNTVKIHGMLSDFGTYGKPDTFDDSNKKLNKISNIHTVVLCCMIMVVVMSPWLGYGQCYEKNVGRDREEICGMIVPAWLPFDLMGTFIKYVFYGYQAYAIFVAYFTADLVNLSLAETMEHIKVRFQHVGTKFSDALSEKDRIIQRKKFNKAVEYHVAVIGLVDMVNESYSASIFVHAFLIGAVIGCSGQDLIQEFSFGSVALIMGWINVVIITCTCGQRLMDEGTSLAEKIYSFNWIGADEQIQKDLIIVLLRCQVPITLQASPLGAMNFSMIVAILNTSYTYLTFLSQTK